MLGNCSLNKSPIYKSSKLSYNRDANGVTGVPVRAGASHGHSLDSREAGPASLGFSSGPTLRQGHWGQRTGIGEWGPASVGHSGCVKEASQRERSVGRRGGRRGGEPDSLGVKVRKGDLDCVLKQVCACVYTCAHMCTCACVYACVRCACACVCTQVRAHVCHVCSCAHMCVGG